MFVVLESMRPRQWIKNSFVFAPLIFSLEFANISAWIYTSLAAFAFILVSGSVYIINDLADIELDKKHETKKLRPIASGRLTKSVAILSVIFLLAIATIIASILQNGCLVVLAIYFAANIAYSKGLKHIAVLDVLIIAIGFVLRVIMGGYAIGVVVSPWIVMATFMVALFLGFGKRRHEVRDGDNKTRSSLEYYNREFLDKLINVSCAGALLSYAMYAVETSQRMDKLGLVYTTVFVVFGIFRYLHFIYFDKTGGEPERIVISDKLFVVNLLAWLVTTVWILA
jgi:4-hydroxybenzoate polyprenyltransferase